ncbi:MAG: type II/IV secretion system ATPase subunit [Nanoarchaeota archaeon]
MPSGQKEGYEVIYEGSEAILRINANSWSYSPSIEDSALVMGFIIDRLVEMPGVSRIMFNQRRNFTYEYDQTQMLLQVSQVYNHLVKTKKVLSILTGFQEEYGAFFGEKLGTLQYLVYNLLRTDPIGCYVEAKRLLREEKINFEKETNPNIAEARKKFLEVLLYVYSLLDNTRMISLVRDKLDGHSVGDRGVYKNLLRAVITPDFMFTRLMAEQPLNGEQVDLYKVKDGVVTLFKIPGQIRLLYHLNPEEFNLNEDEYNLIELARNVLGEHKPREEEFLEPSRLRNTFYNIGKDLLNELIQSKGYDINYERLDELAKILVRYTVGFGLIEILMQDEKVQDIVVNSPIGSTPMFIVHQDFGECVTNIVPSRDDAESWATKFRLFSGRPLDEANPVLDTELIVNGARGRVSVMGTPLSPTGLAYAIRRHRDKPWTLPLFISNKMISPLGAGLISFLVDGARTILVAGTRSSGKTSLLGAIMVEIMRKYRMITLEDTLEIPVDSLRKLGYNIQHMKVRSALMAGGVEVGADEGIRTSLRFGDSSLIIGEVRSTEARALYEAMRIGALANVVAGTIHGADPYSVFDRVVNDLGVPRTSFKATDVIIVANPVTSADGLRKYRRVLQITEVRKHWQEDPLKEAGFMDLMRYDVKKDILETTSDLKNGESDVIKAVAANVREWVGNWDAIWENIILRAKIKEALVEYANKANMLDLLEADFVVKSNDMFHIISEKIREESGSLDSKRIYFDWREWLKREIKLQKV